MKKHELECEVKRLNKLLDIAYKKLILDEEKLTESRAINYQLKADKDEIDRNYSDIIEDLTAIKDSYIKVTIKLISKL